MFPFRLFAATGNVVARLDSPDGASVQTTIVLGNEHQSREGHIVNGVMYCPAPPLSAAARILSPANAVRWHSISRAPGDSSCTRHHIQPRMLLLSLLGLLSAV